jgi:type IX secretion system PorP/SprF family membrane protein
MNIKQYISLFCCLGLWTNSLLAQQSPQYSLYALNPQAYNMAVAGVDGSFSALGTIRRQWTNLEGAPQTQALFLQLPLAVLHSGVGLSVENEQIGARKTTVARLGWNYITKAGSGTLSIGATAGWFQQNLDGTLLRTPNGSYEPPTGSHNDPTLDLATQTGNTPTFDVGAFWQSERISVGFSTQNVTAPKIKLSSAGKTATWGLSRNYFATFAVHFALSSNIQLTPSLLVKNDGVQTQADFSLRAAFSDNIFIGATFRGYNQTSTDALIGFGGIKLSASTTLAYAYDYTLSSLQTVQQGSHEILLKYQFAKDFGKGKLPPIIYNPRF